MLDNGLFESQMLSGKVGIWVGAVLLRGGKKQKQDGQL